MRLVDDEGVVLVQITVVLRFRQQNAVGHQFHQRTRMGLVVKAHLVTDRLTDAFTQLLGNAVGDGARRDAPGLGVADKPGGTAP